MLIRNHRFSIFALTTLLLALTPNVQATQILVGPGNKWDAMAMRAQPGDEIILMPGEHLAALLEDLEGTTERPIIIRSLDAENLAVIKAGNYGLRLLRCRHILIQDIIIIGATIDGVLIDARTGVARPEDLGAPQPVDGITLRNVKVQRTGPKGQRHGIELVGVNGVTIDGCALEGWGGSGVEIVGCTDVTLKNSTLRGVKGFSQLSGIRVRAGTNDVVINNNHFTRAGLTAICVGGASAIKDFNIAVFDGAGVGAVFEARQVRIERNIIEGGSAAITMTHSDRTEIIRNTIVNPTYFVFCVIQSNDFELLGSSRRNTIASNLITWDPGGMKAFFLMDDEVDRVTLKMNRNLWWSEESEQSRARLGELPYDKRTPQIFEVNPELDDQLNPTNLAANGYGANPIKVAQFGDSKP